jgi:phytoene synthase
MSSTRSSPAARASIQRHSRSFSFASRLVPADRRADVERLYAWCRWCDDGVDTAPTSRAADKFVDLASHDLRLLGCGETPQAPESLWFATLVERHDLSVAAAEALLLGMRSDVTPAADLSEADLLRYCFRVAGTVGVLMCPILGLRDRHFLPHAAALGMGMQLTNIARDVAEDWQRGRCYLPLEWTGGLRPGGLPPEREGVRRGVRRVLDLAEGYYHAGEAGLDALASGSRLAVRTAARVYRAIGTKIRNKDFQVLDGRVRVTTLEKLRLGGRSLLESILPGSPPKLDHTARQALTSADDLLRTHGVSA